MNERSTEPVERLCIIGLGLIGGSVGMAAIEQGAARHVCGFDTEQSSAERAVELKAVHEVRSSAAEAAARSDLVVIATPVGAITPTFDAVAAALNDGAIVTDVGSTKADVVEAIKPRIPAGVNYIGGHPIAGSEQTGVEASSGSLFKGAAWILTPDQSVDDHARSKLRSFLTSLGARVVEMQADEHDRVLGVISHLPQLIASTLMSYAADDPAIGGQVGSLAAGGFRDMTRIAASSPHLWVDILRSNGRQVSEILEGFIRKLQHVVGLLGADGWTELEEVLLRASRARSKLPEKVGVSAAAWVPVVVNVPDRPGVLAQLTRVVGDAGVNIEDLTIKHIEGSRGFIHLLVDGVAAGERAAEALRDDGFEAHLVVGSDPS